MNEKEDTDIRIIYACLIHAKDRCEKAGLTKDQFINYCEMVYDKADQIKSAFKIIKIQEWNIFLLFMLLFYLLDIVWLEQGVERNETYWSRRY